MDRAPDDRTISLKLSEVLREIGVNERIVKVRRKYTLLEKQFTTLENIFNKNDKNLEKYNFGSQSEGSTTIGLCSDVDNLCCTRGFNVIQDWIEWKQGEINLLMVHDEASPGYCLLQLLQSDAPVAEIHCLDNNCVLDNKGRILFKNTVANRLRPPFVTQQNGPARTEVGTQGKLDLDIVPALHCESWPKEGRGWLDRQCIGDWPPEDVKRLAVSKGCFLVPVGSKCNNLDEVEWRISTSMAERLMMFNMNITQLMCYVMMKIISKTFFTMNGESTITSFMCKCIVFHCIENTPACYWREDNLFPCVVKCLFTLHECVRNINCPHYIIPSNNLMAHRISPNQQGYLLNVLSRLIHYNTDMFLAIEIDDFGRRLQMKLTNVLPSPRKLLSQLDIEIIIVSTETYNLARSAYFQYNALLRPLNSTGLLETTSILVKGIQNLQCRYCTFCDIAVEACQYVTPLLCSLVGSILASFSVYTNNTVSPDAIWWLSAGFDSDVSCSRLKLASAYYCAGDINNAKLTLIELEQKYTDVVVPVCGCYPFDLEPMHPGSIMHLYRNTDSLNKALAFCVKFIRCEASIIPQELRQELFRSTEEEKQNRSVRDNLWMDFAVVDSLPYLYFLQYKVYKHQRHIQQQRKALSNLLKTNLNVRNLKHRETAWNLLGQCMEQENMPVEARWCYQRSLEIRPHDNAANFHMMRLRRI